MFKQTKKLFIKLLLKSSVTVPAEDEPILEAIAFGESFTWPPFVPDPAMKGNDLVTQANTMYPSVVVAAVLHEIGHAVNAGHIPSGSELELACDRFAALYLLGSRDDKHRDIYTLSLAAWLCCLCSESLNPAFYQSKSHPNPVQRLHSYLNGFVPTDTVVGVATWMMSVAHVMRLARVHNRPVLDEEILQAQHHTLDTLLEDLRHCW